MILCSTVGGVGSLSITALGVVLGERHAPRALKTPLCRFRNGVYAIESLDFKQPAIRQLIVGIEKHGIPFHT